MPSRERRIPSGRSPSTDHWSGPAFVGLATVGVALGLGSAWRLPGLLDQYGGCAFLLAYLVALLLIGLPLHMAELMIGRRGRATPAGCYDRVAREEGRPCRWRWVAAIGGLAGVLLLASGSSVAAQAGLLLFRQGCGALAASGYLPPPGGTYFHPAGLAEEVIFFLGIGAVAAAPSRLRSRIYAAIALASVLLLLLLVGTALGSDRSAAGLADRLSFDARALGLWGVIEATRLALLTLGITLGTVMAHGASLPSSRSILRTSVSLGSIALVASVLAVALVAGVLHPVRMPPIEGRTLMLGQVPAALHTDLGQPLLIAAWYGLVLLGGAAGGLAVLHSVVEQLVGRYRVGRGRAVLWAVGSAWALGTFATLAGPEWGLADALRRLAADLLLPGAALGLAIFAGWAMSRRATRSELGLGRSGDFRLWRALIRYLAPALVGVVLLAGAAALVMG